MSIFSVGGGNAAAGYDIEQSLRFDHDSSARLTKTFSSNGDRQKNTFSCWVKLSLSDTRETIFGANGGVNGTGSDRHQLYFQNNTLRVFGRTNNSNDLELYTTQVFRDPAAWYHIVVANDSTQSTAANRVKIYVNGEQITDFTTSTYWAQNYQGWWGSASPHGIGVDADDYNSGTGAITWAEYFGGYLSEVHYIDGQQLTPSDFAEADEDTNEWKAKKYGGAYGTNGFFLEFKSSGALGTDTSGNGNTYASTNLAATDQMIDTPTNNWCTFNPLAPMWSTIGNSPTLSEGNLKVVSPTSSWRGARSTFVVPKTGKFYCEVYVGGTTNASNTNVSGLVPGNQDNYTDTGVYAWFSNDGTVRYSNSDLTTTTGPTTGDIMSWYVNDGEVKIYLNNSLVYTYSTNLSAVDDDYFFYTQCNGSSHFATANFGQDSSFSGVLTAQNNDDDGDATADWYYAPPTGVESLCSDNLSDPSIADPTKHFNTITWAGSGGDRDFTGVGFSPNLVWQKSRTDTWQHNLTDSVRGVGKSLNSDSTNSEESNNNAGYLDSFDADGFSTVSGSSNNNWWNQSGNNYVAWNWKAGGTPTVDNSAGAGNTPTAGSVKIDGANLGSALAGSIAATRLSANTTSGFSIVGYTSTGGGSPGTQTVAHGLSVAPDMIIVKQYSAGYSYDWTVYSKPVGNTKRLVLNSNAAQATAGDWEDTTPSASVFTIGNGTSRTNDGSSTYIAYCFHSVDGYSKVGSYEGNNHSTDGTFIYTGFRPAFVMIKNIDASFNWILYDNKRSTYNINIGTFFPNTSAAEDAGGEGLDFLSNGIKLHSAYGYTNDANTYIYLAFAESPFKTSNAR